MKNFLMNIWQDEAGAETAEWLVIVALITAMGIVLYPGVLEDGLTTLVGNITDAVEGIVIAPGP